MVANRVGNRGNIDGKILIVGEARGKQEVQQGLPFVGPSGHKLTAWVKQAGIDVNELYITNMCDIMPNAKGGNIDAALRAGTRRGQS